MQDLENFNFGFLLNDNQSKKAIETMKKKKNKLKKRLFAKYNYLSEQIKSLKSIGSNNDNELKNINIKFSHYFDIFNQLVDRVQNLEQTNELKNVNGSFQTIFQQLESMQMNFVNLSAKVNKLNERFDNHNHDAKKNKESSNFFNLGFRDEFYKWLTGFELTDSLKVVEIIDKYNKSKTKEVENIKISKKVDSIIY